MFFRLFCVALAAFSSCLINAQELSSRPADQPIPVKPKGSPKTPNSDPNYLALRNVGLSGEASSVSNFSMQRDAATFNFESGAFYFLAPVNGRVTGAVFLGHATLRLVPPVDSEKRELAVLTKEPQMNESFDSAVFRFTDATYQQIKAAAAPQSSAVNASAAGLLADWHSEMHHKLHENVSARILADILDPSNGGYFLASIHGKRYSSKELFIIDPHGVSNVEPEEEMFMTWEEMKSGIWAAFHRSGEYGSHRASSKEQNDTIVIRSQDVDTAIDKSGRVTATSTATFVAASDGIQVVHFHLFPSLRVSEAFGAKGEELDFIQEDKNDDPDYSVVLSKPLSRGETYSVTSRYSGKDAVSNEGGGNYFPVPGARESWYPAARFGQYAMYRLTFRVPRRMVVVATGTLTRTIEEGEQSITEWKSEVPLAVAGFNLGHFKAQESTISKPAQYVVAAYANDDVPDQVKALQFATDGGGVMQGRNVISEPVASLGSMDARLLMKKPLAEGEIAMQIYSDYFGPISYKRVNITQQTACGFGQSWPGLIYLPICAFWDTTVRHQLGMDFGDPIYFKIVTPHEVAHQWWGHTVGFNSYRDQWMSEGFADLSASIFVQMTRPNGNEELKKIFDEEHRRILDRDREGYRPIDAGPVTMGVRLSNSKTGGVYRMVYPKGAYILHMVRMMMSDNKRGDSDFKAMMTDFVQSHLNQPVTTEDFKAIVEKHMTRQMDIAGDHKMDWFFNEYVYGTALPAYALDYSFADSPGGVVLKFKLSQSKVGEDFRMLVPIYVETAQGKILRLGSATMIGATTMDQQITLNGVKDRPRRVFINYLDDVLAE